jgi:ParB family transcriptional regulator, chromosome partitioning protein
MMQSVSLSVLEAAAANPRRKIDRKAIEGLAASIKTDGVLHNLVVSPVKGKGKKERYQIVSGSRRFEALRLLQERGELPDDFTVAGTTSPRTTRCGLPPSRICSGRI